MLYVCANATWGGEGLPESAARRAAVDPAGSARSGRARPGAQIQSDLRADPAGSAVARRTDLLRFFFLWLMVGGGGGGFLVFVVVFSGWRWCCGGGGLAVAVVLWWFSQVGGGGGLVVVFSGCPAIVFFFFKWSTADMEAPC
ncbi:hypothetical protein Adt_22355 [Abeliophyllum distichum]|uniref:Uncharacterized protein n=1 Tax=Abeliophyllum distichum TaxID=126358 RepID=A0ABD1T1Y4_9LAMI